MCRSVDHGHVDEGDVWPVIVVGAGPAGLVAAIALARAGIHILVLNRRTAVLSHPRATVVSLRSMELLRSWALEDEIRAGGDEVECACLLRRRCHGRGKAPPKGIRMFLPRR